MPNAIATIAPMMKMAMPSFTASLCLFGSRDNQLHLLDFWPARPLFLHVLPRGQRDPDHSFTAPWSDDCLVDVDFSGVRLASRSVLCTSTVMVLFDERSIDGLVEEGWT